jgi:hypothetical protein
MQLYPKKLDGQTCLTLGVVQIALCPGRTVTERRFDSLLEEYSHVPAHWGTTPSQSRAGEGAVTNFLHVTATLGHFLSSPAAHDNIGTCGFQATFHPPFLRDRNSRINQLRVAWAF